MRIRDGATVARWRKRRHLSQRDLAHLCRCSQATISLIEVGKMTTLSEELALKIAHRLDVPWEDLFVARSSAGVRHVARGVQSNSQPVSAA